jgi:enamine deaminase RidA (YjgF/YER057c/UK114 family)
MSEHIEFVNPAAFAPPRGYNNGVIATGRALYVAGQIGWNANGEFPEGFVEQFAQAVDNVVAVVRAAGGQPTDLVKMTVFVTDIDAYRASAKALGTAWKERLGRHYPAMALVAVTALVEPRAMVEIEAVAVVAEEKR